MSYLKVLEEDNIHIIVGLSDEEKTSNIGVTLYTIMSRLAQRYGRRRFTIHVFTTKPRPIYIEDLREMLLNNIAYTIVLRYHDYNLEEAGKLVEKLVSDKKIVYGVVEGDQAELVSLLKNKGVTVEEI
jgi:hypothetical protein